VVNELHGFEVGNELIVRIADLLTPPLLPKDALAARMSGDRFAILLRESTPTEAASIAQQIQRAAAGLRLGPAQNAMDVSISCGIAALTPMPQALDRAIAAAELACKTAKSRGRNRIELYACDDSSMMRRHADAVAVGELRSALKADRLMLYAQRIAPLQNPTLPGGYEILLRLKNEDGTVDAPGTRIMAAQRYQLLPTIDRWVIQRALQTLAPYRAMLRSRRVSISINVSGQSIGDETFVQHFKEQLSAANLPAGCLTVEITEQAAVTNLARANELIRQLSTLGCRFALDDFGTGMNSLTALKNLQIARVKIDGSFVRDILTDRNSLATVRAIVELASGLSMDTVAEYVESKAIAKEVRRLGVDYAQGYAFGKTGTVGENPRRHEQRRILAVAQIVSGNVNHGALRHLAKREIDARRAEKIMQDESFRRQLLQHALQCEVPVALQGERCDLRSIAVLGDVECDPAIVAHIGRNAKPAIGCEQGLPFNAHPKAQRQALFIVPCHRKGSLPRLPGGAPELGNFSRFRQSQADSPQRLEHGSCARRLQRIDVAHRELLGRPANRRCLTEGRRERRRSHVIVRLAHQSRDTLPSKAPVETHTEPAARADVGRNEEIHRVGSHMVLLCTVRRPQPQGDAPVTMVIDHVGRERLAVHSEIG
jgi:diguanylate cyclase (GGDEF)-like protein